MDEGPDEMKNRFGGSGEVIPEATLRTHFDAVMDAGEMKAASAIIGVPQQSLRRSVERLLRRHGTVEDWARLDAYLDKAQGRGRRLTLANHIPRPAAPVIDPVIEDEPAPPEPIIGGQIEHDEGAPVIRRNRYGIRRWLLTVAQNNTHLHEGVWGNLNALAAFYDAEIIVARCTYDIQNNRDSKAKEIAGTARRGIDEGLWFPDEIAPYVVDVGERIVLAKDLIFAADNTIPTLAEPLSGMDTYTGPASMILPHPQIALRSVATMNAAPTKFLFTTGTVSQRNYIPLRTGNKASFHHSYGALLVEKDEATEEWWCRQINAEDATGTFYDFDLMVANGKVTEGHRPEAINWGDIHCAALSQDIRDDIWGEGAMVDAINPRAQMFHDVYDGFARSHHEVGNWVRLLERHRDGRGNVEDELRDVAEFLRMAHRDDAISVVVNSNHDRHLDRWLNEAEWKRDPENAPFFLEAAAARAKATLNFDDSFNMLEWAARRYGCPDAVRFLREDEGYRVCEPAGGIELGLHGDRGANGSRGGVALKKLPFKANVGHSHSAGIYQGLYVAGVMPDQEAMVYATGPSSWSRSVILTHTNGKRQVVTMRGSRWRA